MQSENIAKNLAFPICNLDLPTATSSRVLAISSELPISNCQLIKSVVISEEEARRQILEKVSPLDERVVSLADAIDCFSARDYFARLPLPAFDNSAMDGYAVVASSCKKGGRLRVIGEQPAGPDRNLRVSGGEAVRIFTGAPVPQGADAIVMQEDVTRNGTEILLNVDVEAGEFVRRRGCDLAEGQMILRKGGRIRLGPLAYWLPRVLLMSSLSASQVQRSFPPVTSWCNRAKNFSQAKFTTAIPRCSTRS